MGLLNSTQEEYYNGSSFGDYQFTSLEDIIDYFMVVYIGEDKIIPKASRMDVAFHAQRALQELSFDTLKSIKSQQITLPPTLVMPLPHDYVNYTKVSWSDSAGIKHPLYPTSATSNPFQIKQEDSGAYTFVQLAEAVVDGDFSDSASLDSWNNPTYWEAQASHFTNNPNGAMGNNIIDSSKLTFQSKSDSSTDDSHIHYPINFAYQELDVSDMQSVNLSATGQAVNSTGGAVGTLRVGLSTKLPPGAGLTYTNDLVVDATGSYGSDWRKARRNTDLDMWDLVGENGTASYLEWTVLGGENSSQTVQQVDVENVDKIYVIVVSWNYFTTVENTLQSTNNIDNISVVNTNVNNHLISPASNKTSSSTWNNYKSGTPSENQDDYQDDIYWPLDGERYGLDPQYAQVNGSFYMDNRLGKIHFSSNISGKTVILDYISDSLGTDAEMQVHKFAEEAMYKYISHAILSTSSYGQPLVPRLTKEKFAAIRKAKLRLSNIKLEELTQILRGKSKQIKH
tara:strand:- start:11016 stop:12545 length:1530 start_codon:yes stop_codon:yes gene_type:complete